MFNYEKASYYCKHPCLFPPRIAVERYGRKGRGVKATSSIPIYDFICEYKGTLKRAEQIRDGVDESYCLFFRFDDKNWVIDATAERPAWGLGRLINHSRLRPNIKPKIVAVDGIPHVCFFALRNIPRGKELLYDYGDYKTELNWMSNS